MMKALVRALALVVYASRGVEAYPFGSVACDYGNAAVHDIHSNAGPGNLGLIENGGIELSFDDVVVDPRKPFTLTPGHNYTVALTAPSNKPFLGFMLILRSDLDVDTSKSITPGTEGGTQPSLPKVCPDHVGAVGHSWNNKKYKATAHIKLDTSTPYALDITIVSRNCGPKATKANDPCDEAISEYYYTRYNLIGGERETVAMKPPDGADCWSNSAAITFSELLAVYDPELPLAKRSYTMCPDTTISIGTKMGEDYIYEDGLLPIVAFLPGLEIKCGESGSSKNNCVLHGGQEQIMSLTTTELLEELLDLLPLMMPNLEVYPKALPDGFEVNSNGLTIQGMTFNRFKEVSKEDGGDGMSHSPLNLLSPGLAMSVSDCIFQNGNVKNPASSAIGIHFHDELWSGISLYTQLTVKDCVFQKNTFHGAIIDSVYGIVNQSVVKAVSHIEVEGCHFMDNVASSVMGLQGTSGTVEDSCITNTLVDSTTLSIEGGSLFSTINSPYFQCKNIFESGTKYVTNPECKSVAVYDQVVSSDSNSELPIKLVGCEEYDNSIIYKSSRVCAVTKQTNNDEQKDNKNDEQKKKGKRGRHKNQKKNENKESKSGSKKSTKQDNLFGDRR